MRIALTGRNLVDLTNLLTQYPAEIVTDNPDIVISYGGDGSLLGAERLYPGIPKCPIRDSRSAPKCEQHAESLILDSLFAGNLKKAHLIKLKGWTEDGAEYIGLNDILLNRTIHSYFIAIFNFSRYFILFSFLLLYLQSLRCSHYNG